MKVFISQAMRNRTEKDILEERSLCVDKILQEYPGAEILKSYFSDFVEDSTWTPTQKRIKYLAKSIELLADADVVVVIQVEGSEVPAGVEVEAVTAKRYQKLLLMFRPDSCELVHM
jgi:DNA-binding MurR/RpiR family transcriptional regulator